MLGLSPRVVSLSGPTVRVATLLKWRDPRSGARLPTNHIVPRATRVAASVGLFVACLARAASERPNARSAPIAARVAALVDPTKVMAFHDSQRRPATDEPGRNVVDAGTVNWPKVTSSTVVAALPDRVAVGRSRSYYEERQSQQPRCKVFPWGPTHYCSLHASYARVCRPSWFATDRRLPLLQRHHAS